MNEHVVGLWLVSGFVIFVPGGLMYTARGIWKWPSAQSATFLVWERVFVMAAVVATVLGLELLDDLLRAAGELVDAPLGFTLYLLGAAIVLVAETTFLSTREWHTPPLVAYIVLACLGQAAMGVAILRSGLVASWVGWATILWNVGCPVALATFSRRDLYFPVLHHVAPLVIGAALLAR